MHLKQALRMDDEHEKAVCFIVGTVHGPEPDRL